VMVDHTALVNNGAGLSATGGSTTIRFGDSTLTGNTVATAAATGGTILSYETNKINGNGTDTTPTTIPMK